MDTNNDINNIYPELLEEVLKEIGIPEEEIPVNVDMLTFTLINYL